MAKARIAVDIGGTFTDFALQRGNEILSAKVLTTPSKPEDGVLAGIESLLADAALAPQEVGLIIHGTTLATNAIIERKGAKTALIVTEGHRDTLEMAYENRFAQYDILADRPAPLVPRARRWPVRERLAWTGEALLPLQEESVEALLPRIADERIEAVAVGLLHAYADPRHERRVAEIIKGAYPDLPLSLSGEVCPEIREYDRLSTTVANAYVQPLMARYLRVLNTALAERGFACPFFLITSAGGLTTLETGMRLPIRLVESGPAGGAILASRIARQCALDQAVSFDMGGTTAKICLIDDGEPLVSRTFEVDRQYRYMKGSGFPLKVPVIEMVEIGAGGGSIAAVDSVGRLSIGPRSAGADPGPACYGTGGDEPTVTDADLLMGRLDPERFAGGKMTLRGDRAAEAVKGRVAGPLGIPLEEAVYGIGEMVDESMAGAARVHAIEWGKGLAKRTMIAFGGAAPLHAARLAQKLDIDKVIIPTKAGVGSAVGFLAAPIAFEVVRSRYVPLESFDAQAANALFGEMRVEASSIVAEGAPGERLVERRAASMRYMGQGHEIIVELPVRSLRDEDALVLKQAFETAYRHLYGRLIESLEIEALSWSLTVSTEPPEVAPAPETADLPAPSSSLAREVRDPLAGAVRMALYERAALAPGTCLQGPALVIESETTTVVPVGFDLRVDGLGYLELSRKDRPVE
jgi:N-methylhydantoinase A